MSKAADIKRASNALLEKIAKAQQALEAQKAGSGTDPD